jgi:hypothetical protein
MLQLPLRLLDGLTLGHVPSGLQPAFRIRPARRVHVRWG